MSPTPLFERLAAAARLEQAPAVDVSGRFLASNAGAPPRVDRVFVWMAAGSAAAAAACAVLGLSAWAAWADPLTQMLIVLEGLGP